MDLEKERYEAINAGEQALLSLREAQNQINGAKSWGLWDILGGGSFVSLFKHAKVYKAQQSIENAKFCLRRFSDELRDLSMNLDVNIGDFLTVLDIFDSFLADVIVQSRLRQASEKIDLAITKVEYALSAIKK